MMTCSATLRHNAGEAAIVGAGMSAFGCARAAHGSAVRLERCRDRLRRKLRLCRSLRRSSRLRRRQASARFLTRARWSPCSPRAPTRGPTPDLAPFAEPKFDLAPERAPAASALHLIASLPLASRQRSRSKGPSRRAGQPRRSSTTRPSGLRSRQRKARFRRRLSGSSRVTITAILWAPATGAPRAARSRPSMPGALTRPCGSAKTA